METLHGADDQTMQAREMTRPASALGQWETRISGARALANHGLASVHFKNRAHARTTRRTPFSKTAKERGRTQLQNKTKMAAVGQIKKVI